MLMRAISLFVDPMRVGALAEYSTPEALEQAVERMRDAGYVRLDAYAPYEIEGLAEKLGASRPRAPQLAALVAGVVGVVFAFGLQWWINVVDYPLDVGGRPFNSWPAWIPITFETMILFASFAAFLAVLIGSRLPEPWNPLFDVEGFERASVDRFFLGVDDRDERFDVDATIAALRDTDALRVVRPRRELPADALREEGS